jgi:hypothetical protein
MILMINRLSVVTNHRPMLPIYVWFVKQMPSLNEQNRLSWYREH